MKQLKFVGFVSEYDTYVIDAVPFKNYLTGGNLDEKLKEKFINYLKQGEIISASMQVILDLHTGKTTGPDIYYTDGVWTWPNHMIYYLENEPLYHVNESFVRDVIERDFKFDKNKINVKEMVRVLKTQMKL